MSRIAMLVPLVAILVACQTGGQASGDSPVALPAAPEGYVVTPHGLVHSSCVRRVGQGERVSAQGFITQENGEQEKLTQCRYPRLNLHTLQPIVPAPGVSPSINGWVETAAWSANQPFGYMAASFTVPSAPTANGATIFFFPGLEPSDASSILQPVLQYGPSAAGGGDYWSAASWFCCPAGWSHYTTLINVDVGDVIAGTMSSSCSGSSCDWVIITSTLGEVTELLAESVTSSFVWAFGGALEAYNVTSCTQYPAAGTIDFTDIRLINQDNYELHPEWEPWVFGGTPACNYYIQYSEEIVSLKY